MTPDKAPTRATRAKLAIVAIIAIIAKVAIIARPYRRVRSKSAIVSRVRSATGSTALRGLVVAMPMTRAPER